MSSIFSPLKQTPPKQVQIAIVGMAGSGKTVLVSTLAMKMSQMADRGVFLSPIGDNRLQTLQYIQQNWKMLNRGEWPPSTPAGEIVQLHWELSTERNVAAVRFADCAGQDIHTIFDQNTFSSLTLPKDLRDIFQYLNRSNILLFLVNMEDILGQSDKQSLKNVLNIDQMIYVLNQPTNIPRKCAVVLSQYDKYKPEVDQKFGGDVLEYLRVHLPQLHGQYIRNKSFEIIPVAAVEQTQTVVENGTVKKVPAPEFTSYNLETLIRWIAGAVDELEPQIVTQPEIVNPVEKGCFKPDSKRHSINVFKEKYTSGCMTAVSGCASILWGTFLVLMCFCFFGLGLTETGGSDNVVAILCYCFALGFLVLLIRHWRPPKNQKQNE